MVTTSPWNRPARSITRADVARRAGTSLATVSYVLNDGPKRVSAAARERVRRAIVELGYRPDPVARSFRSLDIDAIGALAALHRLGLAVPDEVAVVAVDATRLSPYPVPALTFVRQPTDLLAAAALDVIDSSEPAPKTIRVPYSLGLRASCGCGMPLPSAGSLGNP